MPSVIIKESTKTTPHLHLNAELGLIEIKGKFIHENSYEVFEPIIRWVNEYIQKPLDNTTVNVYLEYLNTSSSVLLLDMFRKFEANLYKKGYAVLVNWYCDGDDLDMIEVGEDYQSIVDLPIRIIEVA
ncbi:MAG: DUF1987 domain-containing protein [Breznakibacter sp.]